MSISNNDHICGKVDFVLYKQFSIFKNKKKIERSILSYYLKKIIDVLKTIKLSPFENIWENWNNTEKINMAIAQRWHVEKTIKSK